MVSRPGFFLTLALMAVAVVPAPAAAAADDVTEEIVAAAAPYCQNGEVVHRVVLRSSDAGIYQVDLCQAGNPIGGRRYRAKLIGKTWKFEQEDDWLASASADPVRQVRLKIPIDLVLAQQMVVAVDDKLAPGEEISLVKAFTVLGEDGQPSDEEPPPDTYTVTTVFLEIRGGRSFNFNAAGDTLVLDSVGTWSY